MHEANVQKRQIPAAVAVADGRSVDVRRSVGVLGGDRPPKRSDHGGGDGTDRSRRLLGAARVDQPRVREPGREGRRARPAGSGRVAVTGVFAFTHMLTVIIASSYVTLGIAVPGDARRLAVPYGIVVL